jgi:hypothetical protein
MGSVDTRCKPDNHCEHVGSSRCSTQVDGLLQRSRSGEYSVAEYEV